MVISISPGQPAQSGANTPELTQRQQADRVLREMAPPDAAAPQALQAEDLVQPVQRINETLRPYSLEFDLDNDHQQLVTRIVDRNTGDVIRQIPAEEVLRIAARLDEIQGLLIKQQA